jgi:hypothetical protein
VRAALLPLLLVIPTGDFAKELRRVFRPTREPAAVHKHRARALAGAPGNFDEADVVAVVDAYAQLEKELAPLEAKHQEFLERGARDKSREPRPDVDSLRELMESAITLLRGVDDPALARPLCEQAIANKRLPLQLRLALAETGRLLKGEDVTDLVKRANKARQAEDRLISLVLAAALGRSGAGLADLAIEALADENDLLRVAAVDALVATAPPAALAPLIDRLEHETGRVRPRVTAALQVLTGARIHGSVVSWRRWLEEEGGPFLAGERTLGHGEPVTSNAEVAGSYYGLPLEGDALLFVIDISKSMSAPLRKPKDGAPAGESRMARAKAELVQALSHLNPSKRFGIIAFGGTLERFSDALVPADEDNIAEAQRWIEDLGMNLGTRVHDALQLAFVDAGRTRGDSIFDPEVETIFLLTDGRPIVAGKTDKAVTILRAARRFNLRRHVVIHTIGLGNDVPKGFMKNLAADHGGRFVHERGAE